MHVFWFPVRCLHRDGGISKTPRGSWPERALSVVRARLYSNDGLLSDPRRGPVEGRWMDLGRGCSAEARSATRDHLSAALDDSGQI